MSGETGSAEPDQHTTVAEPRQALHSAEQVRLDLPIAGPSSRMLAYAIDGLVVWTVLLVATIGAIVALPAASAVLDPMVQWLDAAAEAEAEAGPQQVDAALFVVFAVLLLVGTLAEMAYFVLMERITGGRSPGKAIVGLRVVGADGRPLGWERSLTRNLLRVVDVLPSSYLVGLVSILVSRQGGRLGDLAAGTVVARMDRPQAAHALDPRQETEGFSVPLDRDQLARVGAAERTLLRQTLRRARSLPPEQADRALERAVDALRDRLDLDEEVAPEQRRVFLASILDQSTRRGQV